MQLFELVGRSAAPALLVAAALLSASPTLAETVVDSAGQQVESSLDALVTQAREMRMEKLPQYDLDRSTEILEQITKENPDYYRAWFNLALAYLKRDPETPDPYLKAFQAAADIQEKTPTIRDGSLYNSFGWALLNNREYATAEKYLTRGLLLSDTNSAWTNSALNYNLGRLHFEQGNLTRAENFLIVAVQFGNPAAIELKSILDKVKE